MTQVISEWVRNAMSVKRRIRHKAGGHWIWTGRTRPFDDYPIMVRKGKTVFVARYLWEKVNGPVPQGKRLRQRRDICSERLCVCPDHRGLV